MSRNETVGKVGVASGARLYAGRYELIGKIGAGGMATVFKARDAKLDRVVAIKTMLPELSDDEFFTRRFENEAKAAAKFTNPNIVRVYDWGHADGRFYIAMEYVDGTDLKSILRGRHHLNPRETARIASQVCAALEEAHAAHVIHRDIKTANIMVQPTGGVKIMDFGIAQAGERAADDRTAVMGTAHYMSPEQINGYAAGEASDLYSLGVVMYESCVGRLPFAGMPTERVLLSQLNVMPIAPMKLNQDVDRSFNGIIMRCLAKHPAERFQSALELRNALARYLANAEPTQSECFAPSYWALGFVHAPTPFRGNVALFRSRCTLGCNDACDLVFPAGVTGGSPVRFFAYGSYLEVDNAESMENVAVNGERLSGKALCQVGATVDIGGVRIRVGSEKRAR